MPEFITVTAPPLDDEGTPRKVALADRDANERTGLAYAVTGRVSRVRYSQDIRRSINRGDLFPCDRNGKRCTLEQADAPKSIDPEDPAPPTPDEITAKAEREQAPKQHTDASRRRDFDTSDDGGKR